METPPVSAEDRLFAALAYVYWYVAFPIYLLSPRYQQRPFLRYHLFHALVLGLVVFWGGVALWTVSAMLGQFGLFGLLLYPVLRLSEWAALGLTAYAAFSAWMGRQVEIPYITEFVRPYLQEKRSDDHR
jgi:hypothetical protein